MKNKTRKKLFFLNELGMHSTGTKQTVRNNGVSVKRDRESNPLIRTLRRAIESIHINEVFILNGFLSQRTKKTFRNGPLAR